MRRLIATSQGNWREVCNETASRVCQDGDVMNRSRYKYNEIRKLQRCVWGSHGISKRMHDGKSHSNINSNENLFHPIWILKMQFSSKAYKDSMYDEITPTLLLKGSKEALNESLKNTPYDSISFSNQNPTSINNTLEISNKDANSNAPKQKSSQSMKMVKKLKKRQLREKAKRLKIMMNSGQCTAAIPMQTDKSAEILFDCLAPHLNFKTFDALIDSIHWFCEPGTYSELLYLQNNDVDIKNNDSEKRSKQILEVNLNINPSKRVQLFFSCCEIIEDHPWMKPILSSFLLGESLVVFKDYKKKKELPSQELYEKQYNFRNHQSIIEYKERIDDIIDYMIKRGHMSAIDRNGLQFKKNVNTLMKAREKSAKKPPKWGSNKKSKHIIAPPIQIHSSKSENQKLKDAEDMASILANRLPQSSYNRLFDMLQIYARDDNNRDNTIYSSEDHKPESNSDQQSNNKMKRTRQTLKNLFPRLKQKIQFHVPLIISELAHFLYVDIPVDIDGNEPPLYQEIFNEKAYKKILDERLDNAWEKWNKMRVSQSKSLSVAQNYFALFDIEKENYAIEKKRIELSLEQTPNEETKTVDSSSDNDQMESQATISKEKVIKHKEGYHVIFDAIQLKPINVNTSKGDERLPLSVKLHQQSNMSKNKVFLINLPIDITSEELEDCYSRCGPITSIQIFNLRPDLDPGKRSLQQRRVITKKERLNMKEIPKCTPIYALVEFATNEGYQMATNINLIIFGMVIRRHTVKTVPTEKITSLFIENIPSGYFGLDLEYKFNKVLQPHIYVCLDTVEGFQGGVTAHRYQETKSTMIQFPSFELALFAYEKLKTIDIFEESLLSDEFESNTSKHEKCTLQWLKTPSNAMKFWTRQISYE